MAEQSSAIQRVDALDEAPGGGLVEVLGHRDERHAATANQRPDGDVVLHVPSQAVDLVDDGLDVAVLFDPGQHGPQARPVGRTGRLALVPVLVDELPVLVADASDPRLALGGDGERPFGRLLFGLLFGRDLGRIGGRSLEVLRLFEKLHTDGLTLVVVTHDERIAAMASWQRPARRSPVGLGRRKHA
jgi:DNA-binding transcriptional LysR family regulator